MSAISTNAGFERRYLVDSGLRANVNADRRIEGYAIRFNSRSLDLGGFVEEIAPSAVDRTIREGIDVRAFWSHDSSQVLGRLSAGTLQMRKDRAGLRVVIDPPKWADSMLESISRGDVSGMSFGFRTISDEWHMEDEMPIRTVTDMRISEVSIVALPAYEATSAEVAQRSLQAFMKTARPEMDARSARLRLAR